MILQNETRRRRLILGVSTLGLLLIGLGLSLAWTGWFAEELPDDAIHVPLTDSPFLRDVVEPIAMVRGSTTAGSDDHWMGLTFRDGRGVEREVKFVYYWPRPAGTPPFHKVLLLGERVPVGDRQEKAFLGLLQRWLRDDADAQELLRRLHRGDFSHSKHPQAFPALAEQEQAKIVAGLFLGVLRDRPVD